MTWIVPRFNKEINERTEDIWALWAVIEGMALFLIGPPGLEQWCRG